MKIYGEDLDYNHDVSEKYNIKNLTFMNNMYVHGELQDANGFDLIYGDSDIMNAIKEGKKQIIPCTFVTCNGKEYDAVFYYWSIPEEYTVHFFDGRPAEKRYWHDRGFVVAKENKGDNVFAKKKYDENVRWM